MEWLSAFISASLDLILFIGAIVTLVIALGIPSVPFQGRGIFLGYKKNVLYFMEEFALDQRSRCDQFNELLWHYIANVSVAR